MATEIECIVDTGGTGDYVGIQLAETAWFGASGGALVTQDEWCNVRLRSTDGAEDASVSFYVQGWTNSDATRYIKIWTDLADLGGDGQGGSYRHLGKYPSAGQKIWNLTCSQTPCNIVGMWVKLDGLCLRINNAGSAGSACIYATGTASVEVSNCCCDLTIETGSYPKSGIQMNLSNGYAKVWNNIVHNFDVTSGSIGIYFLGTGAGSLGYYYDNTVYDCYYGVMKGNINGTLIIKGNLSIGCNVPYYGTFQSGSSTNGYDSGSAPTGSVNDVDLSAYTATDIFVDPANDDFHEAPTSPTKGAGIDLSTDAYIAITTDFEGHARKSAPDLGADEIAGVTVPVEEPEEPGTRPGGIDRGRQKRERSRVVRREEVRKVRDISKAFVGMYRRLDRGN